jgi:hypothetical protein
LNAEVASAFHSLVESSFVNGITLAFDWLEISRDMVDFYNFWNSSSLKVNTLSSEGPAGSFKRFSTIPFYTFEQTVFCL